MATINYKPSRLTDGDGTENFYAGLVSYPFTRDVYFNYSATQIYVGSIVMYELAADPDDGFSSGPGFQVIAPTADYDGTTKVAGVVTGLGDTEGTSDGWISIGIPVRGWPVKLAVAEEIDSGDFVNLAASGVAADGGTTDAAVNMAVALFDEDDSNNPYGTSALGDGTGGYVDAIWMGGGLEDS